MTIKKTLVLAGALMILGVGSIFAAESPQSQAENVVQERVSSRFQVRTLFIDENGDGICDLARDHDNDGIPNCQDPNWIKPEDGTGYKNRNGMNLNSNQFGNRKGNQTGNSWNRQSFGQNQGSFGSGVCDGTGPKGKGNRNGRG
jgi:hypothetical protein